MTLAELVEALRCASDILAGRAPDVSPDVVAEVQATLARQLLEAAQGFCEHDRLNADGSCRYCRFQVESEPGRRRIYFDISGSAVFEQTEARRVMLQAFQEHMPALLVAALRADRAAWSRAMAALEAEPMANAHLTLAADGAAWRFPRPTIERAGLLGLIHLGDGLGDPN